MMINLWRTFPDVKQFWASPSRLELGHWGKTIYALNQSGSSQLSLSVIFNRAIRQQPPGIRAQFTIPVAIALAVGSIQFSLYGWGDKSVPQQSTAGWLSFCPFLNQDGRF